MIGSTSQEGNLFALHSSQAITSDTELKQAVQQMYNLIERKSSQALTTGKALGSVVARALELYPAAEAAKWAANTF